MQQAFHQLQGAVDMWHQWFPKYSDTEENWGQRSSCDSLLSCGLKRAAFMTCSALAKFPYSQQNNCLATHNFPQHFLTHIVSPEKKYSTSYSLQIIPLFESCIQLSVCIWGLHVSNGAIAVVTGAAGRVKPALSVLLCSNSKQVICVSHRQQTCCFPPPYFP